VQRHWLNGNLSADTSGAWSYSLEEKQTDQQRGIVKLEELSDFIEKEILKKYP